MAFGVLFDALSPRGAKARLSILIFHRVLPVPDSLFPGEVDAIAFDQICAWVSRWFHVLPLDVAVQRMQSATLPSRAMAITFDDGYADNHDIALPILRRYGLTATCFISTGFLDGGQMWNDTVIESIRRCPLPQIDLSNSVASGLDVLHLSSMDDRRAAIGAVIAATKYLPSDERAAWVAALASRSQAPSGEPQMMRSDQVRALHRAGMGIGAHTVSHPILATLSNDLAHAEIADGRRHLEDIVGDRVGLFAYPNGKPDVDYHQESVSIVRELGFDAAVSTHWGSARRGDDVFQLPRFTPWDRSRWRFGMRLARNLRAGPAASLPQPA